MNKIRENYRNEHGLAVFVPDSDRGSFHDDYVVYLEQTMSERDKAIDELISKYEKDKKRRAGRVGGNVYIEVISDLQNLKGGE